MAEKLCIFNKEIHHYDAFNSKPMLSAKVQVLINVVAFSSEEVILSESGEKHAQNKHNL